MALSSRSGVAIGGLPGRVPGVESSSALIHDHLKSQQRLAATPRVGEAPSDTPVRVLCQHPDFEHARHELRGRQRLPLRELVAGSGER